MLSSEAAPLGLEPSLALGHRLVVLRLHISHRGFTGRHITYSEHKQRKYEKESNIPAQIPRAYGLSRDVVPLVATTADLTCMWRQ